MMDELIVKVVGTILNFISTVYYFNEDTGKYACKYSLNLLKPEVSKWQTPKMLMDTNSEEGYYYFNASIRMFHTCYKS